MCPMSGFCKAQIEPGVLYMPDKHSTDRAPSPAPVLEVCTLEFIMGHTVLKELGTTGDRTDSEPLPETH